MPRESSGFLLRVQPQPARSRIALPVACSHPVLTQPNPNPCLPYLTLTPCLPYLILTLTLTLTLTMACVRPMALPSP